MQLGKSIEVVTSVLFLRIEEGIEQNALKGRKVGPVGVLNWWR